MMGHLAGALHQLQTAQAGQIVIDYEQIIVVVAGELPQRAVPVNRKLDAPVFRGAHIINQFGNELVVLDMQNRNLRAGPLRAWLADLSWNPSGPGKNVGPSLSISGPGVQ